MPHNVYPALDNSVISIVYISECVSLMGVFISTVYSTLFYHSLVSTEEEFGFLAEGYDVHLAALVVEPVQAELPVLYDPTGLGHLEDEGLVCWISDWVIHSDQH